MKASGRTNSKNKPTLARKPAPVQRKSRPIRNPATVTKVSRGRGREISSNRAADLKSTGR